MFGLRPLALVLLALATVGCGKKGPPLAPLVIVPAAVGDVSASRFGDQVVIRFTPPVNATGNPAADVSRVEVYALSVEDVGAAPEASVIVREGTRVGSIAMMPEPQAGGAPAEETGGPRTFSETLTAESHRAWTPKEPSKRPPDSTGAPAAPSRGTVFWIGPIEAIGSALAVGQLPPQPARLYAFVPVSTRGRRGAPTTVVVPLAEAPPAPSAPLVTYTETALDVTWVAIEGVKGYNLYERGATGAGGSAGSTSSTALTGPAGSVTPAASVPLNEAPLKQPPFQDKRVEFGKARCYSVTAVATLGTRRIESPMSNPACVTPEDTFPPPAPTGLAAVAGPGTMSLIWDAVAAADLAGYLVLRADAPDGTLQALTPEPIKDTTYRDTAVTPGTRYAYVVLAVDRSKNRSAPSPRVEETAR